MNYIVLAIPVFLLLIVVELVAARVLDRDYYRLNDALSDLSCGILQQLLEVFLKTALFAGYVLIYQRYSVLTIGTSSALAWTLCFLGVDFFYYWFHRASHEVNAMWATHVVHHQSEDYNLAVALRQGALQGAMSWVFYLPLAWAGFPPLMFLTLSSVNTLYQFWIHTRAIGWLGPLEWVLNTPSNHRVHHGRNPKYIDRNHGGTLIVWDRFFGTYQAEDEAPVYGITTPLASWNPVWANLHYWIELFGLARRTRTWQDRLRLFVKPPGWRPAELGGYQAAPEVDPASYRKWNVAPTPGMALYVFVQFVPVLFGASLLLFRAGSIGRVALVTGASFVVAGLLALGGLLERKPWAIGFEASRLALVAAVALANAFLPPACGTLLAAVASLTWLLRLRAGLDVADAGPATP